MKNGVSQIRDALQRVGGESIRIEGRNKGYNSKLSSKISALTPLAQKDFGFFPLLAPEDQTALIEKVRVLWALLRKSAAHSRELKNTIKRLEKENSELEEKYIGLSSAWNDLLSKTPDKDI